MVNPQNVTAEFDSVFIKKAVKSRESFVIWIPKDEAQYLNIDDKTFLRVGLKKLKNEKRKK
ncbi:hypothetical protein J4477_00740 [Candidatus Pacearchaeota archaeon]|nr:hypothetical protein [Candidatus Pacearchaeota archaeon]